MKVKSLSRVRLLVTPWTAAYQAPPFMGFSRQECWSGVPLPSPYITTYLLKKTAGWVELRSQAHALAARHAGKEELANWPSLMVGGSASSCDSKVVDFIKETE